MAFGNGHTLDDPNFIKAYLLSCTCYGPLPTVFERHLVERIANLLALHAVILQVCLYRSYDHVADENGVPLVGDEFQTSPISFLLSENI